MVKKRALILSGLGLGIVLVLTSCGGKSESTPISDEDSYSSNTGLCATTLISEFKEVVRLDEEFQTRVKTAPPDWYEELSRREAAQSLLVKVRALDRHAPNAYCAMETGGPLRYPYQHTAAIEARLEAWLNLHK